MAVLNTLIGVILLTLGRKLFWLFVACVGFVSGFTYAKQLWGIESHLMILLIGMVVGLIGAVLAVFLQSLAIGLAGFIAGGFISVNILDLFDLGAGQLLWLPFVLGGIVGALLLLFIFDWALIFLSSLTGAALIVQITEFSPQLEGAIFLLLAMFGIVFQATIMKEKPSEV